MAYKKVVCLFLKRISLRNSGRIAAAVVIVLSCLIMKAEGAVFLFEPSVALREEYNDNIYLKNNAIKIESFITVFSPSVRAKYTTSFWDWDLNYTYNYYYYTSRNVPDYSNHFLVLSNRTEIVKDYLFLQVFDEYKKVSQDIAVNYTNQSPIANQVDQNLFRINPYIVLKPAVTSRIILGYTFFDRHYFNGSTVVTPGTYLNHTQNIGYGETAVDLSSKLTFTTGVRYAYDQNTISNYNQYDIYAGPQYNFALNTFAFARAGRTWLDFDPKSDASHLRREYWFWDAGISHQISTITLGLHSLRLFAYDPLRVITMQDQHSATITNVTPSTVLTINGGVNEYRDAMIDQRLSTSVYALSSILYRLTSLVTGFAGVSYQDMDFKLPYTGIARMTISSLRIDYLLAVKSTLSFEYRNVSSQSDDIPTYNYYNNRYFIEFSKVF